MAIDTPDAPTGTAPGSPTRSPSAGLVLALASAASFGLSGSLARGLMDAGWSAGAAVTVRVAIAALVLLVPGLLAVRGRLALVRASLGTIAVYGLLAVAGAQLFYFLAVARLDVGVALLLEYTAPLAVVLWMWFARGQRPGPLTFVGAAIAGVGLVLLLDLLGGADVDALGVAFALIAMIGAATYFVISADDTSGLPPITLAAGGLLFAAIVLGLAAAVGLVPFTATTDAVTFSFGAVPWWLPVVVLGVVTAAFAYVTGIAAARHLGSRLASFVALIEVAAGIAWAWLLVDQTPAPVQLLGAGLVLGGVVVVKLGERAVLESVDRGEDLFVDVLPPQESTDRT